MNACWKKILSVLSINLCRDIFNTDTIVWRIFACGSPKRESELHHFYFKQKTVKTRKFKREGWKWNRPRKSEMSPVDTWHSRFVVLFFPKSFRKRFNDSPQPSSTMSMATLRNMNNESASISISTRYSMNGVVNTESDESATSPRRIQTRTELNGVGLI